ncbi:MAG: patatin-like phospholipase family protein [Bacteroidota bacterium]
MSKKSFLFTVFLVLIFSIESNSQRVGLVLSGGGAKGLAHIGVIRALEENNIPIDYITGTSMGAIIGGLYSIGYSPDQMEDIVTSKDFRRWANGEIAEKYIYFFKQNEISPRFIDFNIEMKDSLPKAKFPGSLVPTHVMDLQIMRIFSSAAASANYDFDNLFVPFRCIGTDITNNKEIVFSEGNLALAVRASMTFPFYFRPIKKDSIIYFDGGIKNNFPSDVMIKDFNPDFIIGSKTAENAPVPDVDDAFAQLQNMVMGETDYEIPDSLGYIINNKVDDIELFSFRKADSIIARGYRAAKSNMDKIKKNIDRRRDTSELKRQRSAFRYQLPKLEFNSIKVEGTSKSRRTYINKYINKDIGSYTTDDFKKDYFKLLADNSISSVYPLAKYDSANKAFDLILDIDQESNINVGIGGNISSGNINQGFAELRYNHLGEYSKQIYANVYYGRLYSSAMLSGRIDFPSKPEFYLKGSFTLNRMDYFNSSSEPFFEDVRPSYFIKNENFGKIEVGFPVKYSKRLLFGVNMGNINPEYYLKEDFFKSDTIDKTKMNYFYPYVTLEHNTLNYRQYATKGTSYRLKAYYLQGKERFIPGSSHFSDDEIKQNHDLMNLNFRFKKYINPSDHFSFGFSGELNLTNRKFFTNYNSTMLSSPSYKPFPHSRTLFLDNYIAHNYLGGAIHPILKFDDRFHLRSTLAGFLPYRDINSDQDKLPVYSKALDNFYYLGNLALVYQTVLGPVSLSVNYYNKENQNLFFLFNFGYILSNDEALK